MTQLFDTQKIHEVKENQLIREFESKSTGIRITEIRENDKNDFSRVRKRQIKVGNRVILAEYSDLSPDGDFARDYKMKLKFYEEGVEIEGAESIAAVRAILDAEIAKRITSQPDHRRLKYFEEELYDVDFVTVPYFSSLMFLAEGRRSVDVNDKALYESVIDTSYRETECGYMFADAE